VPAGAAAAPEMVQKFQAERASGVGLLRFPSTVAHRLRTPNLGEGWFKHLRRYLTPLPGA